MIDRVVQATPTGPVHVALLGQANSVHLQRWAKALHERGRRVTVLSQQVEDALPLPAGVPLVALPHKGPAGYFLNAWPLRRWLAAQQPDLLHAHYASGYGTTAMLSGFHPLLLSVWGSDVYEFPCSGWLQRRLLLCNLRAADGIASTSQAMAGRVRQLWPAVGEIAITPFGVDLHRFTPQRNRDSAQGLVIGTVKTLASKYGIDTLLRGFALMREGGKARLLIVGDGPDRAALQELATKLGLDDRVTWAGAVAHADVPAWLHRLHVYVAVSRHDSESFGVAVVEAMACGLPVVVSDAGGLPEVVADGTHGWVVRRDDPAALAAALDRLAADASLRAGLAQAAREHVQARYAWPTCVSRMIATQDAVIARVAGA